MAVHVCKECLTVSGLDGVRAPDDCPQCGHHIRWTHRRDGRNLVRQFNAYKRAQTLYPPPPEDPDE